MRIPENPKRPEGPMRIPDYPRMPTLGKTKEQNYDDLAYSVIPQGERLPTLNADIGVLMVVGGAVAWAASTTLSGFLTAAGADVYRRLRTAGATKAATPSSDRRRALRVEGRHGRKHLLIDILHEHDDEAEYVIQHGGKLLDMVDAWLAAGIGRVPWESVAISAIYDLTEGSGRRWDIRLVAAPSRGWTAGQASEGVYDLHFGARHP